MKRGFSLLAAIIFVIVISSLAALSLSLSSTTLRQTSEIYLREQAELVASGATEYAILSLLKSDFAGGCLNEVKGSFNNMFDFKVQIKYFGDIKNCKGTEIKTKTSYGTVMLDTIVTSSIKDLPNQIRLHKRTLQKL